LLARGKETRTLKKTLGKKQDRGPVGLYTSKTRESWEEDKRPESGKPRGPTLLCEGEKKFATLEDENQPNNAKERGREKERGSVAA